MEARNSRRSRTGQLVTPDSVDVSLYFHIPFCTKKCPYCHFYVVPDRADLQEALRVGLKLEWERQLPLLIDKRIVSIYFGGGTPTLFAPDGIAEILSWTKSLTLAEDCEITIEANPEEVERPLLKALRKSGVNRLSLGVQSLDDPSLQVLERAHSAKRARAAIFDAHASGFENISIDLMYDLPWQTESSWQSTLQSLAELPIAHLSLYNLTIEPHTVFFKRRSSLQPAIPQGELSLRLLEQGIEAFEKIGLKRYEISAFAKPDRESRHNSGYWTGRPFLGYGPSAFSDWDGKRFRNTANLQRYKKNLMKGESPVDFEETLPYPDNLHERLAVRLRLTEGVDTSNLGLPQETLAKLERLGQDGYLTRGNNRWKLSPRGLLFYDSVAEEII